MSLPGLAIIHSMGPPPFGSHSAERRAHSKRQLIFEAMRSATMEVDEDYNPYEVVGSGLDGDVLAAGRIALQKVVEDLMRLFDSAGKA